MFRFSSFLAAAVLATAVPALAALPTFTGRVVHVSTDNIKVQRADGTVKSFLLVPHFDQVFQFDGRTTYQMKRLQNGDRVRVFYDEHALGIRHADRIVDLSARGDRVVHG